jgi:hypothetical protein
LQDVVGSKEIEIGTPQTMGLLVKRLNW